MWNSCTASARRPDRHNTRPSTAEWASKARGLRRKTLRKQLLGFLQSSLVQPGHTQVLPGVRVFRAAFQRFLERDRCLVVSSEHQQAYATEMTIMGESGRKRMHLAKCFSASSGFSCSRQYFPSWQ